MSRHYDDYFRHSQRKLSSYRESNAVVPAYYQRGCASDQQASEPASPGQAGRICASKKISADPCGADGAVGQVQTKILLELTHHPASLAKEAEILLGARSAPPGQEGLLPQP